MFACAALPVNMSSTSQHICAVTASDYPGCSIFKNSTRSGYEAQEIHLQHFHEVCLLR